MAATLITTAVSPLILELRSERLMHAISALRAGGFRVASLIEHPGSYVVEDARRDALAGSPVDAA